MNLAVAWQSRRCASVQQNVEMLAVREAAVAHDEAVDAPVSEEAVDVRPRRPLGVVVRVDAVDQDVRWWLRRREIAGRDVVRCVLEGAGGAADDRDRLRAGDCEPPGVDVAKHEAFRRLLSLPFAEVEVGELQATSEHGQASDRRSHLGRGAKDHCGSCRGSRQDRLSRGRPGAINTTCPGRAIRRTRSNEEHGAAAVQERSVIPVHGQVKRRDRVSVGASRDEERERAQKR